jgi:hypothetical protein
MGRIAENLLLRKQLALFQERHTTPRRAPAGTRIAMIALAKFFNWRKALAVIQLDTFIRWHRTPSRVLGVEVTPSRSSFPSQEPPPPYICDGSQENPT